MTKQQHTQKSEIEENGFKVSVTLINDLTMHGSDMIAITAHTTIMRGYRSKEL